MDFNDLWFNHAILMAKKSKDPRTKVGAVIVEPESNQIVSSGYNGPVRGWDDTQLLKKSITKEEKNRICEHAERNAIYNAARNGSRTLNCDIYITLAPCHECCRAIIQAGIKKVWVPLQFARPMSHFLIEGSVGFEYPSTIEWLHNTILLDGEEVPLYKHPHDCDGSVG